MLLLDGDDSTVYTLAFSPDGRALAAGTRDGMAYLWDEAYERQAVPPPDADAPAGVNAVEFRPDGQVLVSAGERGWVGTRLPPDGGFWAFDLKPAGGTTGVRFVTPTLLAVGRGHRAKLEPGRFELWDTAAGRRMEPSFPAAHGVRAVAALPGKKLVAWSEWGGRLGNGPRAWVWEITRPAPARISLSHNCPALALNPDGTRLAAAVEWGVRVFDLTRPGEAAVLKGHKGAVTCVAFSPDGRSLATGSWDGTVRFWDVATGAERAAFAWPVGRVYAVAYSPDGLRLAAGGDKGTVVVWDVE